MIHRLVQHRDHQQATRVSQLMRRLRITQPMGRLMMQPIIMLIQIIRPVTPPMTIQLGQIIIRPEIQPMTMRHKEGLINVIDIRFT